MKSYIQRTYASGFLMISAIIMIVVVGFLASIVAYLVSTEMHTSTLQLDGMQAFYIARSGLERAFYRILSPTLTNRIECTDVHTPFTDISLFGKGTFTATGTQHRGYGETLAAAIDGSSNITEIIISGTASQYLPHGRLFIDQEAFDYSAIDTSNFKFTGVVRAVGGTLKAPHVVGTPLAQNECLVSVKGSIPNASSARANRTVTGEIKQLEEGWLVGEDSSAVTMARWNGTQWSPWSNAPLPLSTSMNAIAMMSYNDLQAVCSSGDIFRWNGTQWLGVSFNTTPLFGISCTRFDHCRAVGQNGTFLQWNGGSWSANTIATDPIISNTTFRAVSCADAMHCAAVGDFLSSATDNPNNELSVVQWNTSESKWKREVLKKGTGDAIDLKGISCPDNTHCRAVGTQGTFIHMNGAAWDMAPSSSITATTTLYSIFCLQDHNCKAVGSHSTLASWNGLQWSHDATDGSIPAGSDFRTVHCARSNDCWAAGDNGVTAHWNGTQWSRFTLGSSFATTSFRGIALHPGLFATDRPLPVT